MKKFILPYIIFIASPFISFAQSENGSGEEQMCSYEQNSHTVPLTETNVFNPDNGLYCDKTSEIQILANYEGPCQDDYSTWPFLNFTEGDVIPNSEVWDCDDHSQEICYNACVAAFESCMSSATEAYEGALLLAWSTGQLETLPSLSGAYLIAVGYCEIDDTICKSNCPEPSWY